MKQAPNWTAATPPRLTQITLFPVKSLPGVVVPAADVLPSGALGGDRRWALFDKRGEILNGKRCVELAHLQTRFDQALETLTLRWDEGPWETFRLDGDLAALGKWLSQQLGTLVKIEENRETGFPDDLEAPGPTIVSTATLDLLATWFPGWNRDEARRRFRANLEVDGLLPFGEEAWVAEAFRPVPIRIGDAIWGGLKLCQRCRVPSRSPETGQETPQFQRHFVEQRRQTLPTWTPRGRLDHFYRLAVNTVLLERGTGVIRVGDTVATVANR